jgi:hypothetical protein
MENPTAFEPSESSEPSNLPSTVGECIRRIDIGREEITRDQTDIDQLQEETRAILERLRLVLPAA